MNRFSYYDEIPYQGERHQFSNCCNCGIEISVGDEFFNINGEHYCVNCINNMKEIADDYD